MSDSLQPHGLPCPSLSPGVCSDSCPLSQWCYLSTLSSAVLFSICLQSFPVSGSFPIISLFTAAAAAKLLQSCPTLCDPRDGSPPGSSIHGIFQARVLEWVAISFSNAWKWKVKVKSLSRVRLLATPWTAAYQAPPFMGFSKQEYWSGVPLPSPFALHIRWQKYWSFSFSIRSSNVYSGLISFRIDWFELLAVQGTLKSLFQHHSLKASILWHLVFFLPQFSHPYMTTGKTIALTRQTFIGKVMSLLFNT